MPSAIEIYDEKQRAFDRACFTLDGFAGTLYEVAHMLKNREALLRPRIRCPIEDDGKVDERRFEEGYTALLHMPDDSLIRNAIMILERANLECVQAYEALSEVNDPD